MTNIYDVLSKIQSKASAAVEKTVAKDLEVEDPSTVEVPPKSTKIL